MNSKKQINFDYLKAKMRMIWVSFDDHCTQPNGFGNPITYALFAWEIPVEDNEALFGGNGCIISFLPISSTVREVKIVIK